MKQNKNMTSTIVGTTTETMMIRVELARCKDPESSVRLAEFLVGLAERSAVGELSTGVAEAMAAGSPMYVG